MKFTYDAYRSMLLRLLQKEYYICDYQDWKCYNKSVILRHDIDNSIERAVKLSDLEAEIIGGKATYFVLLSTEFYNVFSRKSREMLQHIICNGGRIGLHFDETQYEEGTDQNLVERIRNEAEILSDVLDYEINVVSMHRPSKQMLDSGIKIPGLINSYDKSYFSEMKYVSDSRRNWRENVEEIIEQENYSRLHILTHAFWYEQEDALSTRNALLPFILNACLERYDNMNDNFRDLASEIKREEIERIIQ